METVNLIDKMKISEQNQDSAGSMQACTSRRWICLARMRRQRWFNKQEIIDTIKFIQNLKVDSIQRM